MIGAVTIVASEPSGTPRSVSRAYGALAGLLAAGVSLATTVFVDGLFRSVPSLVVTVGQAVIDLAPGEVAREGTEAVGRLNKPLVLTGVVVLSLLFGAGLGRLASSRLWAGIAGFTAFGVVGVVAAIADEDTSVAGAVGAAVIAVAAGGLTLYGLLRAAAVDAASPHAPPVAAAGDLAGPGGTAGADPVPPLWQVMTASRWRGWRELTRRRFIVGSGAAAAGAAFLATGGRRLAGLAGTSESELVGSQRAATALPRPVDAATPAASELRVPGADPWATPNDDFYRIDTALVVPAIDAGDWRLRIGGMVDRPLELTMDDLLKRPMVERWITLACVSNEVGGDLIGNARWLGVPLLSLLEEAGISPSADAVVGRAVDGFTVAFPLAAVLDGRDTLVAVGMNGEPLPQIHGFPARLVVPGLYGYVSATKWLEEIELSRFDSFDAYWIQRGWAEKAPIKTQSRIDVPRRGQKLTAGEHPVAGVAWAQQRGIERVEVRIDEEPWQDARIGDMPTVDSWVQWVHTVDFPPGEHVLQVRATDATGERQPAEHQDPFPDGATGWHTVRVEVD